MRQPDGTVDELTFTIRRLKPEQEMEIQSLGFETLPPIKVSKDPKAEPSFDLSDPAWQAKQRQNQLRCRSLALYYGVPVFEEGLKGQVTNEKGEVDLEKLVVAVQAHGVSEVLEQLFDAVLATRGSPAAYADFFSNAGSQKV